MLWHQRCQPEMVRPCQQLHFEESYAFKKTSKRCFCHEKRSRGTQQMAPSWSWKGYYPEISPQLPRNHRTGQGWLLCWVVWAQNDTIPLSHKCDRCGHGWFGFWLTQLESDKTDTKDDFKGWCNKGLRFERGRGYGASPFRPVSKAGGHGGLWFFWNYPPFRSQALLPGRELLLYLAFFQDPPFFFSPASGSIP